MRSLGICCLLLLAGCFDWQGNPAPPFDAGNNPGSPPDAGTGTTELSDDTFPVDGPAWPSPWTQSYGVASAIVDQGRGRLVPAIASNSLGRMLRSAALTNVEVAFTISFEDPSRQAAALYVRHNGGYLAPFAPAGLGYGVYVSGFPHPQLALWRELFGVDGELVSVGLSEMVAGASYRVRFRCVQNGDHTLLFARIWAVEDAEPDAWMISTTDSQFSLQNALGNIALDNWSLTNFNNPGPAPAALFVDDFEIFSIP